MTRSLSFKMVVAASYSAALITLSAACVMVVIYRQTFLRMAEVWLNSVTFRHGLVIIPISAWLIWRRRTFLTNGIVCPNWWAVPVLLALATGWLVGRITDVAVVQELAMIAMVPGLVVLIMGWSAFESLRFPLLYLFFAVPVGWFLVPPLMHVTAALAVYGLKWTGIPVYQDGYRISVPTGDFLVATACSGIRYLIACLALGTLFAYLFYRSSWRRLLFMGLAVMVPIIANGIRAYGIILLAYLSDMRIATGFDHVIYGFIFFSLILFLMFWLGSLFREDLEPDRDGPASASIRVSGSGTRLSRVAIAALLGVALVALGPMSWATVRKWSASSPASGGGALIAGIEKWTGPMTVSGSWRPKFVGDHQELAGRYRSGADSVEVFVEQYPYPHQGEDVASSLNRVIDNPHQLIASSERTLPVTVSTSKPISVTQSTIQDRRGKRLVWSWYRVDGHSTANPVLEKLWEALSVLRGGRGWAQWVSVSTPVTSDVAHAQAVLAEFLRDNYSSLETCLSPGSPVGRRACSR